MAENIKISKKELYYKIWNTSLSQTASELDVSYQKLKKLCADEDILLPGREYTADRKKGIAAEIPPFPEDFDGDVSLEKISHRPPRNDGRFTVKANTLCILKLLYDYSDADRILTQSEILRLLREKYELEIERKTLYSSIEVLRGMGYYISAYEDNGKGYYLETREFDLSEIRILMDCVYSNTALPVRLSEELIKKLQKFMPEHRRKYYKNLSVITTARKTANWESFMNIEILDEAISMKKKVEFTYMKYAVDKSLCVKSDKKYVVSPYALVSTNDAYYLVCKSDGREGISHYRIDKMQDVCITNAAALPPPLGFDISKHTDASVFMYGNHFVDAEFVCHNDALGHVIDKFGHDIRLKDNKDGKTFTFSVNASFDGLAIWAVHYLDVCEVVWPHELRDEVIKKIKSNVYGV